MKREIVRARKKLILKTHEKCGGEFTSRELAFLLGTSPRNVSGIVRKHKLAWIPIGAVQLSISFEKARICALFTEML